ncbi:MAG: type II toxin-antitoxin system RelB/DinJ family antitoxin [Bacteroidales bacterium]|nr:type II toxin-antitoxin system RelB/DinJ family antitoxin [Bacteroidales bacterium]
MGERLEDERKELDKAKGEKVVSQKMFCADKALKQEVKEIYESLGMDLPTALRMFMNKSKMVKGVPFDVRLPENTVTRAERKKR